jgi:hypothetical protein
MGKWKGVKRNLHKKPDAPLELYNLETDISEEHNVTEQYPHLTEKI